MKVLAAIYSHHEYYPPTLNAIDEISQVVDSVLILSRNVKHTTWHCPLNTQVKLSGRYRSIRASEQAAIFWKVASFINYLRDFYDLIRKHQPEWVVCYDPIPLFSFQIVTLLMKHRPKLWYHNHDVLNRGKIRKYSITWFAYKWEGKSFAFIDLFTLPSEERKAFFPLHQLKGTYLFLPNYPSKRGLQPMPSLQKPFCHVKLLYQGHVGPGHGLMEVIRAIKAHNFSFSISLSIVGEADTEYKEEMEALIQELNLQDSVRIFEPIAHRALSNFTKQHHIGLAIHEPVGINFKTASTASNKIYEYIRCGLPVILFDGKEYRDRLEKYDWAFFTNLQENNILAQIGTIYQGYHHYSQIAYKMFREGLNFDTFIGPVLRNITSEQQLLSESETR